MGRWPEDVRSAAVVCREALEPLTSEDWDLPAGSLDWSSRKTLEHVIQALAFYARDLATPVLSFSDDDIWVVAKPESSIRGLVGGMEQMAAVVAAVVAAAPPDVRALHPFGMSDRTGFAAMACDELLVHTGDICAGLGASFEAPAGICEGVLARLFPWAPTAGPAWQRLLWANGRVALPGRPRLGRGWVWHAAPLDEAGFAVRAEQPGDEPAVRAAHLSAFETSEEADIVDALRDTDAFVPELSLVAVEDDAVVGHMLLTRVELEGDDGGPALALAPIGVQPDRQRRGIGRALTWAGIEAAEQRGERLIIVLGHAGYYPWFGFVQAAPLGVECPFDAPPETWMALVLDEDHPRGLVRYAEPLAG